MSLKGILLKSLKQAEIKSAYEAAVAKAEEINSAYGMRLRTAQWNMSRLVGMNDELWIVEGDSEEILRLGRNELRDAKEIYYLFSYGQTFSGHQRDKAIFGIVSVLDEFPGPEDEGTPICAAIVVSRRDVGERYIFIPTERTIFLALAFVDLASHCEPQFLSIDHNRGTIWVDIKTYIEGKLSVFKVKEFVFEPAMSIEDYRKQKEDVIRTFAEAKGKYERIRRAAELYRFI